MDDKRSNPQAIVAAASTAETPHSIAMDANFLALRLPEIAAERSNAEAEFCRFKEIIDQKRENSDADDWRMEEWEQEQYESLTEHLRQIQEDTIEYEALATKVVQFAMVHRPDLTAECDLIYTKAWKKEGFSSWRELAIEWRRVANHLFAMDEVITDENKLLMHLANDNQIGKSRHDILDLKRERMKRIVAAGVAVRNINVDINNPIDGLTELTYRLVDLGKVLKDDGWESAYDHVDAGFGDTRRSRASHLAKHAIKAAIRDDAVSVARILNGVLLTNQIDGSDKIFFLACIATIHLDAMFRDHGCNRSEIEEFGWITTNADRAPAESKASATTIPHNSDLDVDTPTGNNELLRLSPPEGPHPPNKFKGPKKTVDVPPIAWRLINYMWKKGDCDSVEEKRIIDEIWGPSGGPLKGLRDHTSTANSALLASGHKRQLSRKSGFVSWS